MIDELLSRARQRVFLQSFTDASVLSATICFAACALVLIAGTGLLAFWIPIAAGAGALGLALFRAFRDRPTALRTARVLDRRCSLFDALATEIQFRDSPLEVARVQRAQAEALARTVNVEHALPFRRPHWLYPLVGFVSLASFLFFLRFGMERRLDFQAPLTTVLQDPLSLAAHADAAKQKAKPETSDTISRLGTSTPEGDEALDEKLPNPAGNAVDSGAPPSTATPGSGKAQDGEQSQAGSTEPTAAPGAPKNAADQSPSSRDGAPQSAQSGAKGGSPESSGLLSKLRDAMSGLMSKMKPQGSQSPPGAQQSSQQASSKQPNGNQQSGQKSGQDGQKSSDGQPQAGDDDSSASDSEQSKSGDGKGKTDQNAAVKPGSGMGHSDGSKELKDAEQLAAMGKLSEIIGKRSASVTGEMTIESQSGPQQLRTGYARSDAKHGAASGDVTRDEVPVELQPYVKKYFEQVRKQESRKDAH